MYGDNTAKNAVMEGMKFKIAIWEILSPYSAKYPVKNKPPETLDDKEEKIDTISMHNLPLLESLFERNVLAKALVLNLFNFIFIILFLI